MSQEEFYCEYLLRRSKYERNFEIYRKQLTDDKERR